MLDEAHFRELGEPAAARLERLPIWARLFMRSLRAEAIWWHSLACGRRQSHRRVVPEPTCDRVQRLPVFAINWICTLRFEVYWWRLQAFKRLRPRTEPSPNLFEVEA